MTYATLADVMLAMPTLVASSSHVTSAQVGQHLAYVEAYMTGRLAQRYTVPLSADVPLLAGIATDLTIYRLLGQRVYTGATKEQQEWLNRFREAGKVLDRIVEGAIGLVTDAGTPIEESAVAVGEVWSSTMDCPPIFGGCCDRAPGTVPYEAGYALPYPVTRHGW